MLFMSDTVQAKVSEADPNQGVAGDDEFNRETFKSNNLGLTAVAVWYRQKTISRLAQVTVATRKLTNHQRHWMAWTRLHSGK